MLGPINHVLPNPVIAEQQTLVKKIATDRRTRYRIRYCTVLAYNKRIPHIHSTNRPKRVSERDRESRERNIAAKVEFFFFSDSNFPNGFVHYVHSCIWFIVYNNIKILRYTRIAAEAKRYLRCIYFCFNVFFFS